MTTKRAREMADLFEQSADAREQGYRPFRHGGAVWYCVRGESWMLGQVPPLRGPFQNYSDAVKHWQKARQGA